MAHPPPTYQQTGPYVMEADWNNFETAARRVLTNADAAKRAHAVLTDITLTLSSPQEDGPQPNPKRKTDFQDSVAAKAAPRAKRATVAESGRNARPEPTEAAASTKPPRRRVTKRTIAASRARQTEETGARVAAELQQAEEQEKPTASSLPEQTEEQELAVLKPKSRRRVR